MNPDVVVVTDAAVGYVRQVLLPPIGDGDELPPQAGVPAAASETARIMARGADRMNEFNT